MKQFIVVKKSSCYHTSVLFLEVPVIISLYDNIEIETEATSSKIILSIIAVYPEKCCLNWMVSRDALNKYYIRLTVLQLHPAEQRKQNDNYLFTLIAIPAEAGAVFSKPNFSYRCRAGPSAIRLT